MTGARYPKELKAIREARDAQPNAKAKTLAKELESGGGLGGRSMLSIYSVIRRYDASKKLDAKNAKRVKAAGVLATA